MTTIGAVFDPTRSPCLDLHAASLSHPDATFVTVSGEDHSYASVHETVVEAARGLLEMGLSSGDRVVVMLPNRIEAIVSWLAVQAIGAIDAPVSLDAGAAHLAYVHEDLAPTAMIGTPDSIASFVNATRVQPALVVVVGDDPLGSAEATSAGPTAVPFAEVLERGRLSDRGLEHPSADTLGTIMYSSGTTGPSKGVMLSQGYYSALARVHELANQLRGGSTLYCVQPLCHVDARSAVIDALHLRGRIVLGERFSASRFWDDVETHDVDVFFYVGTMIHLLFKQPQRPRPKRSRTGMGSATPASIHRDFEQRFNVMLLEGYGMTEFGVIANQIPGRTGPGHIGPELPWVDVCIVDELDRPVPDGVIGELLARPREAHLHMLGYWRKPEATVEAWRGLWFHTGDLVRRLPGGDIEYVGRTKDSIRRRGENISAWEVEEVALKHPSVLEAAAIGVPSDVGEEDVALLIVLARGRQVEPQRLREFMAKDLARFALPRYVEIVDELPKTPSERIAKSVVRNRGITEAAIDLETDRSRS